MDNLYTAALQESTTQYSEKVKARTARDKELFNLGWKVGELSHLSEDGCNIMVEVTQVLELLNDDKSDLVALNMAKWLFELSVSLETMLKGTIYMFYLYLMSLKLTSVYLSKDSIVTKEKQQLVFLIMISAEDRIVKPYALPIQLISYTGLEQTKVRAIINGVVAEMTRREMKVAGEILVCVYTH